MYGAPRSAGSAAVNPVFNGDARICQINAVDTATTTNVNGTVDAYNNVDNWPLAFVNGPNTFSIDDAQNSEHPLTDEQGFSKAIQCVANPAIAANLLVSAAIPVESFDLCDYIAQALTLSFWVFSPFAGPHYVTLYGGATGVPGSGPSFAAPYRVNVANAWEKKIIPISFPVADFNIVPNGARALTILFPLIVGANFRFAANFIGTWNSGGSNVITGADHQQVVNGALIRFTDVAIRPGTDQSFPRQNFGDALQQAKRYYWQTFQYGQIPVQGLGALARTGAITYRATNAGAVAAGIMLRHPRQMRAAPAVTFFNTSAANTNWRNETGGADSGAAAVDAITSDNDSTFVQNPQVAGDAAGNTIAVAATFNARL